jgi:hypothetical protein
MVLFRELTLIERVMKDKLYGHLSLTENRPEEKKESIEVVGDVSIEDMT